MYKAGVRLAQWLDVWMYVTDIIGSNNTTVLDSFICLTSRLYQAGNKTLIIILLPIVTRLSSFISFHATFLHTNPVRYGIS